MSSAFCHKVHNVYSWLTGIGFFPLFLVSDFFFFQSSVSVECHCMFCLWSLYIPSNISELLQCFLPCIWVFLLLFPKAFDKFSVFQWFWRSGNRFPSSSLHSWMLFFEGILLLLFRVSHWALLAAVISEGYQQEGLCVWGLGSRVSEVLESADM